MSQDSLRKNITVDSPVDFSHIYRVLILKGNADYTLEEKEDLKNKEDASNE